MRWLAWIALALAGCGDDAPVDAPLSEPGPRCNPDGRFGAPEPLLALNTTLAESAARFSPDQLEVVFARQSASGLWDLWASRRASIDDAFDAPSLMAALNSIDNDVWPSLSPDRLFIVFDADRTTPGSYRPYSAARSNPSAPFGPPTIRSELALGDVHVMLANDHALYFASGARAGVGMNDIWYAPFVGGVFGTPVALVGGVNTAAGAEATPAVTPDERRIYFSRVTGGEMDMFAASRSTPQDGFGVSSPVVELNSAGVAEMPTWISPDGCDLYYDRDGDLFVAHKLP